MLFYLANELAGQPTDIWHDPNAVGLMGLGIGIAAIFVAIAVGIYQVRQGRIRRKLVYQKLSDAPIVSVNSAVADQVEIDIRVKGTPAKNAHLLILTVENAGKTSIHSADYFEPLTFEFSTKVLQASVLETTPPTLIKPTDLNTFLTLNPQSVQFPTFPLNTNESIQISILLEEMGIMKVRGRLDQGTVVELGREKQDIPILIMAAAFIAGLAIAGLPIALAGLTESAFIASLALLALLALLEGLVQGGVALAYLLGRRTVRGKH